MIEVGWVGIEVVGVVVWVGVKNERGGMERGKGMGSAWRI